MVVKAGFPSAMPTVYKGVQLRSRLEGQTAFLLDALGMTWEYEPKSYMLSNGASYLPDFYVDHQRMYVECRGYQSERGDSQIQEFGKSVSEGQVGPHGQAILRFVALRDTGVECYRPRHPPCEGCMAARCSTCQLWGLIGFGDGRCPTCLEHGRTIEKALVVAVDKGKILLNGTPSEQWDRLLIGTDLDPKAAI